MLNIYKNSNEPINNNGGYFQEENVKIEIVKKSIIITDLTNSLASGNECDIKIFKTSQKFETMADFLAERDITSFKELLEVEKITNFRVKKDFSKAIRVYSPFASFNLVKEPKKWTKTHLSKAIVNGQVSSDADVNELAIALIEKENLESSIKVVSTNDSYTELNISSLDIKSVNVRFYSDVITDAVEEIAPTEEVAEVIELEETHEEVFNEVTDIVEESQSLLADETITLVAEVSTDTEIEETSIEFVATNESVQMLNTSKINDLLNIVNSNLIHQQSQVVPFKQYILKAKEKYY